MSNPNNPSDFVQVRLSSAGLAFTGESQTLRFGTAHSDYLFTGQTAQKVLRRGEMPMFLAYTLPDGSLLFELAPTAPSSDSSTTPEDTAHAE